MVIEKELYVSSVTVDQNYRGEKYIILEGLGREKITIDYFPDINDIGKLAGKKVKITIEEIK